MLDAIRPAHALASVAIAAAASAEPPLDFLRGPPVSPDVARTLVRYEADGSFARLQGRPEIAAALLLSNDADTRDRLRALEHDRAERLREYLLEHFDTLLAAVDARQRREGPAAERALTALQRGFGVAEGTAGARDPLFNSAHKLLGGKHDELKRLTNDYWRAWSSNTESAAQSHTARTRTEARLAHALFREEVLRLYRRTMRTHHAWADDTAERLRLNARQRAELRRAVGEAVLDAQRLGRPVRYPQPNDR